MKCMEIVKREAIVLPLIILLITLSILIPHRAKEYLSFIDWRTIAALTGLLVVATGMKESGFFNAASRRILLRLRSRRKLAISLILLSAFLSTFLTNDVALFILVPLTLSLQCELEETCKFVVFEAIAANAGSTLTPIGNPQNLFLWHHWSISFVDFVMKMFPVFAVLLFSLLLLAVLVFKDSCLYSDGSNGEIKRKLAALSLILMLTYIIALDAGYATYILPLLVAVYAILYRNVLRRVDWLLLLIFAVMFIDFHLLSEVEPVSRLVHSLSLDAAGNVFVLSILTSQIMSNVPAAIFLSKFTHNWLAIAYGVNVGGNGVFAASLANIIALRMVKNREVWIDFHRYSIVYLLITSALIYILFF